LFHEPSIVWNETRHGIPVLLHRGFFGFLLKQNKTKQKGERTWEHRNEL